MLEQFRFVRLNTKSKIAAFDCGDADLNDFMFLTEKDAEKNTRLMYFDLLRMLPLAGKQEF